jgi:iron complex transport system substrate-binding protein
MRIVPLIASATEIVHALGLGEFQVGRSHECDFPPAVKDLPPVTEPKFRLDGTSYQIDQRVKAILQEGLSVYRVDASALDALQPDVIITQSQCAVCAVSLADIEAAVGALISSQPQIVCLEPNSLDDIFADIRKVAGALEVADRGEELVATLQSRMHEIARGSQFGASRPRVATIEWIDPLMAGGNWMPTLVEMAGGINLFGDEGRHSPMMAWEEILQADPDIVIVTPCGFSIARTVREMPTLVSQPGFGDLKAVRTGRLFVCDGNQYFNRPGPRVVKSLEILAELFHPELFAFGHKGDGWVRFDNSRPGAESS